MFASDCTVSSCWDCETERNFVARVVWQFTFLLSDVANRLGSPTFAIFPHL